VVGTVGSLTSVPKPHSPVIADALSMLTTFGDPKHLKKLMEEMLEVQKKNEHVFVEAQALLAAIKKTQADVQQQRSDLMERTAKDQLALDQRLASLNEAERRLSDKSAKFSAKQQETEDNLSKRTDNLKAAEQALKKREVACAEKESELTSRDAAVTRRSEEAASLLARLKNKEAKLRAVLDSG